MRSDLGDAALRKATFEAGNGDAELVIASLSLCWRERVETDVVAVLLCAVVPQRYLHQEGTIRSALSEYTLMYTMPQRSPRQEEADQVRGVTRLFSASVCFRHLQHSTQSSLLVLSLLEERPAAAAGRVYYH